MKDRKRPGNPQGTPGRRGSTLLPADCGRTQIDRSIGPISGAGRESLLATDVALGVLLTGGIASTGGDPACTCPGFADLPGRTTHSDRRMWLFGYWFILVS